MSMLRAQKETRHKNDTKMNLIKQSKNRKAKNRYI